VGGEKIGKAGPEDLLEGAITGERLGLWAMRKGEDGLIWKNKSCQVPYRAEENARKKFRTSELKRRRRVKAERIRFLLRERDVTG